MKIKNNHYAIFIIFYTLLTLGCDSSSRNLKIKEDLTDKVGTRLNILDTNFRHKLEVYSKGITSSIKVDSLFYSLNTNQNLSLEKVNEKISEISLPLNLKPIKITEQDDFELVLLLNELLILDELIFRSQVSSTFGSVKASVFIKNETKEEIEYYIGVTAYDELFNPEIEAFSKSDTFPVYVDDDGFGHFTLKKITPNQKHSFSGDVIIYSSDGKKERLPFKQ
ncbi:hypothetical protein EV198_1050 [Roseivirga ehrenbergii]|uniref:Uncharacterized protein n=1 Tax=Roseivirga ehrenbergii (strain DSM 102268 / JCM 13514 / KCTC 12282 / NCIMB 14502 / KMM 6017) TaxID=279360 RepID=A0A150X701_ROSEK|nr:hypothetical protein [Roseivirga ehrenbergii]KYG74483.1 hypothetical protein MB14_04530 [Roseivirga ehrenbergii]TCL14210.1 hypothetical protein EV198_1050 [Roseivirga ehrenbergii]